jgi:membrane fusion protein (multidrug efflux system)
MIQSGCANKTKSKKNEKDKTEVIVPVEVAEVTSGDISAFFSGTATLQTENETEVVAKVGGIVNKIIAEEGDIVKSDQVLAKLDDEKLTLQMEQAFSLLQKLENEHQRAEELFNKNLISTEEFQKTKYEYEYQKSAYNLTRLDLEYTNIRSPIDGVIVERMIKAGNMILANQAVYRVMKLNPLIAVLYIPECNMSKLLVGQSARLSVDAISDVIFNGYIKRISPIVDPATGTFKVTVEIEDNQKKLKPGMFARVEIIYDVHKNVVLVPKEGILAEDKESCVYVVRDSLAFRQIVETGYINTSHTEIMEGLFPGDTIVTTGKGGLKDSSKVEIVKKEQ